MPSSLPPTSGGVLKPIEAVCVLLQVSEAAWTHLNLTSGFHRGKGIGKAGERVECPLFLRRLQWLLRLPQAAILLLLLL